jgi:hypothetical protein
MFWEARYPREWAERSYADLRRSTSMPRGGNFVALESRSALPTTAGPSSGRSADRMLGIPTRQTSTGTHD